MAAALADRLKRARLAILAHVLPLSNPVRVAEELTMLDYLTGGRLVAGFLRGTVNEDQPQGKADVTHPPAPLGPPPGP